MQFGISLLTLIRSQVGWGAQNKGTVVKRLLMVVSFMVVALSTTRCGDHVDDRASNDIQRATCTQTLCGDECVNLALDPQNCGGCGHECSSLSSCVAGTCVP
jgi:hypothetical protein